MLQVGDIVRHARIRPDFHFVVFDIEEMKNERVVSAFALNKDKTFGDYPWVPFSEGAWVLVRRPDNVEAATLVAQALARKASQDFERAEMMADAG